MLKILVHEIHKNATDVFEAVQKASKEFLEDVNKINNGLNRLTALQVFHVFLP